MEKKNFFAPLASGLGATRRAAAMLLVMMLTTATAWAQSTETLGGYTFTIGTDGDGQYYIVDCEAALRALSSYSTSNSCSGKRFVQTADITLTGTFAPIGGNSSSNNDCFKGTYDGGGHTISGLQVEVTSSNFSSASAGLFSEVLTNGVVRNVGLIAPSVSCSCSGKGCRAGAIAGYVEYGTITNCFVLNPGTIMASNGSVNYTGLFIGDKAGGTYANLYYYGTTALPMCGGKYALGSNHIERIYKVTAGSNAGLPTRAATEGFIAQGSHYYREGATVQLSYTGSNPNSYRPVYSVSPTNTGASVTEQGVLTMGNGDITITATLSNIPLINISTGTIADIADQAYTGSAIVPDITLTVGGKVLTAGSDYLVSCTNNVNVGTATLTATGQGNYTGTLTKNFRIYYADKTSSCGTNVTYTLHDEDQNGHYEQLIISGTGAMTDFNDPDDVPWAAYCKDITSVIVQSGVTHIGACAFYLCWYLTSVSLSEGLTSIGNQAFKSCIRLSALTVPASVESVGLNSFEGLATSVSGGTLTFASGSRLTSVGNDAFYYAHASVDMSACTRLTAMPKAFQGFDKDVTFPHSLTSIAANCFSRNSSKDAKVYVHVPDNYVFTVNGETISATNGKADITSAIGVGTEHAAVTLSCTPDPAHFSVNGDGSYTIHTATGWNVFCDCLDDNDTYNRFSGKTVKLGNDIGTAQDPITRMAGSSKHDFCGTFDGDGHTLTVNIRSDSRDYTAPFSYVSTTKADPNDQADSPAAIRNLNVAGTVTATKDYAGGIVGAFWGTLTIENCTSSVAISTDNKHAAGFISCARGNATLRNCLSSVTINSTVSGDGTHSGFIGGSSNGVTTTIEGCAFIGSMLGSTTTHCAGFVGYNSGTLTITNSLYAPADDETWVSSDGSATFARGNAPTTTNTYYTRALGDAQGKACHSITAGEGVTLGHAGEAIEYNVSGITAYKASDAHGDNDPFIDGLVYNEVLYAGDGDEVSLTLANTTPAGYQYGYSASAGTLSGTENPYTLTMPEADVTITVGLSVIDWATESDGDADHPYMIYNKDQLDLLAYRVNGTHGETANGYSGKYFKLGNDINYSHTSDWNNFTSDENNFEAIGGSFDSYNRIFRGHFDGNNKTISGIRIYKGGNGIANDYQGLFGWTAKGADIHDLTLADARITGHSDIGGIVGYNGNGTVNRCHVAANVAICAVQSSVSSHGGIVGVNDRGTIENCISAATLTVAVADNSNYYGGIAGTNRQYSTLHDNLVIGATVPAVTANSYGAITGHNNKSTLQHNYYTACKVADVENATGVGSCNADVTDGAVPGYLLTLGEGITSTALSITIPEHKELNSSGQLVTVAAVTYNVAAAGTTVWFNSGETEGYSTSYIVDGSPVSGNSITMPAAPVTVTSNDNEHIDLWGIDGGADGSSEHPYIITTTAGWFHLAGNVAAGKSYSDKYFQLGAGISISTMVGTSDHPFSGHFNGNGNTLDIDIISVGEYTAPFRYVSGATITGLHTTGTVTTSHKCATGLVGRHDGDVTISDCRSSVTIASSIYDDGAHGGFAATGSGTVTIEGCLFDGVICCNIAKLTNKCGGFVGWRSGTVNISNSLYAPAAVPEGKYAIKTDGCATFARNGADITNCYYTQTLGDAQGKACHSITAGENVTIDGLGAGTEYSVSGITAYPTGIKYNDVYYAGSGDQVSLTLSHGDKAGYAFNEYTATAGTLSGEENPYTLTMPDGDVTINTALRSDGQSHDITYIDADGKEKIASAIALDGTENSLAAGWYFVGKDIDYTATVTLGGDVNLILADGKTMNVTTTGDDQDYCINAPDGHSLHIYGQTEGTGALNAQTQGNANGVIYIEDGTLGIHGGNVTATVGGTHNYLLAICVNRTTAGDALVIDRGTLTANGNNGDGIYIEGGDAHINGGQVAATGASAGITVLDAMVDFSTTIPGILTLSGGTLTASGFDTYSGESYAGTLAIAAGHTYTDGTSLYDSTTETDDLAAISGQTLQPCLTLADAADNTAAIAAQAGKTLAVALSGRTLYKDGDWNTLCLPFDVSTTSGPLAGDDVVAMTLNTSESNLTGSTLTLNFKAAETIPAGTPFIIKWATKETPATDLVSPVFTGVTIDKKMHNAAFTGGTFKGTYNPIVWDTENKSILFVGENNTLYYPKSGAFVNACRAYFDLGSASAREFVMNFDGENEVTSLPQPLQKEGSQADAWYTLDGRKLNGKPTTKGLYIHNGKKVIIK